MKGSEKSRQSLLDASMDEDYISRKEHDEFARRMDAENNRLADENKRQNNRIDVLEKNVSQISSLANSVDKLAVNMDGMLKELEKQGKRVETLESRDGEMWRKVTGHIITVILGIVVGYIFTHLGM